MSGFGVPTPTGQATETATKDADIECVTRDPREAAVASPAYLAVCNGRAAVLACSVNCPSTCGGHPVCRPCFDLGVANGLVVLRSVLS